MNQNLLTEFEAWNQFVKEIQELNWDVPLEEGKWTIHDLVSHIMLWDQYFLKHAIEPIANDQSLTLTLKNVDFNEFNRVAMESGKTWSKNELVQMTIDYRNQILDRIRSLSDETFTKVFLDQDGNKFVVAIYLEDFIYHDRHHMKQIEGRRELLLA